jgi:hypothetical protein
MTATEYEAVPAVAPDAASGRVGTLVMKFGGTSVADPDKLRSVAQRSSSLVEHHRLHYPGSLPPTIGA